MKKLFSLLLLFPLLLQAQLPQPRYKIFPSEYDCHAVSPLDGKFYSVLNSSKPIAGAPAVIDGCGCLHHSAFIDASRNVWVMWDNSTETLAKTAATNARQIQAYNNGSGNGVFIVTMDGKLQILGNSQSGFRGDGTDGNANETTPFTVTTLPKSVTKAVAGTYAFALLSDSTVWAWGGGSMDDYHAQYSMGVGSSSPSRTRPTQVKLPEPIIDIEGGGDWSYAVGKSGKLYGTAYDVRFLGLTSGTGQSTWYSLGYGNLPGAVKKLSMGAEATYALMPNGDLYAWGNNTQAAIGNGQEGLVGRIGPWGPTPAPWGVQSNSLWVTTPYKVNPPGVVFVNVYTNIGDAFYVYAEDSNGNLWVWGRNKGFVLWNGQGGSSTDQASMPNKWDVLSPTKIPGFGTVVVTPPPPPANVPPTAVVFNIDSTVLSASGPDTVSIDGTHSFDKDGSISSYSWSVITGPSGASIGGGATATGIFPSAGTYTVQLVVRDNAGALDTALAYVKVLARTCPPVVVCPPPVVCPPIPVPRTVTGITFTLFGQTITLPPTSAKIAYSDGTTQ